MKKMSFLLIICMLFFFSTTNVKAKGIHLFANIGTVTNDTLSFDPFLWSVGANLDVHLSEMLMLSPEANIVTYKFDFDMFLLQPAVLLNVKLGSFFIGGGFQKYFLISGDNYIAGDWGLKLNAGLLGQNFRLRGYMDMAFDNLFKDMLIGFQIGLGF